MNLAVHLVASLALAALPIGQVDCCGEQPHSGPVTKPLLSHTTKAGDTQGFKRGERGYLGVWVLPPEAETQDGLEVVAVDADSPAEVAGFKPGWKILSVNGEFASSFRRLVEVLDATSGSDLEALFMVRRSDGWRDVVFLTADVRGAERIAEFNARLEAELARREQARGIPPPPPAMLEQPSATSPQMNQPESPLVTPVVTPPAEVNGGPPSPPAAKPPAGEAPAVAPADDDDWAVGKWVLVAMVCAVVFWVGIRRH